MVVCSYVTMCVYVCEYVFVYVCACMCICMFVYVFTVKLFIDKISQQSYLKDRGVQTK